MIINIYSPYLTDISDLAGSELRLVSSYFSDRTQRVQINGIKSYFASLLCGMEQGSVVGPMKLC